MKFFVALKFQKKIPAVYCRYIIFLKVIKFTDNPEKPPKLENNAKLTTSPDFFPDLSQYSIFLLYD